LGHYGQLKTSAEANAITPPSLFGDNFNSFLFRTNITVYGKDFSGLLVTKQMAAGDYRVIFTTELGMKLFDFEFRDTSFTLHYCVPQFNRPKLLQTIREDIRILLMNDLKGKEIGVFADPQKVYDVYRIRDGSLYNYYFVEKETNRLVKIEHSKKHVKKIIFTLGNYQEGFPNAVLIRHYNIRLKIALNLLKK
jgi:hypothetical protein